MGFRPRYKHMITYPIRINHYLAEKQVTTRRNADVLIDEGKIFINGKRAKIGQMVQEKDKVSWDKAVKQNYSYIAYYKPLGLVTVAPQPGERVIDLSKFPKGVSPVGRLDKDSEGLIILSDDGRITDALLNPKKNMRKSIVWSSIGKSPTPSYEDSKKACVSVPVILPGLPKLAK